MQHDFILLDRSGSMAEQGKWPETLSAVNAYVAKLAEDKVDTGVTLAMFDLHNSLFDFQVIRDRIIPSTWRPVTSSEASPRGWTPLNDATGKIVQLANAGNYDKVAIIIMTDGQENSSKELTVDGAKKLLDDCRAKGWQVIFLGANFDNAAQARGYGNAAHFTVSASSGNFVGTMRETATKRSAYGSTGATMSVTDDEKKKAATK